MSDSEEEGLEKTLKLIIVGDGTCGKTSLVRQFIHGNSNKDYNQTLGVEFYLKNLILPEEKRVTVQVWDIGGQTLGGQMLDKYISGSKGVLLVYDIMNQSSFDNLEDWLESIRLAAASQASIPYIALVANKCDMEYLRAVKLDAHRQFAEIHGFSSHFVSARTGESVNWCFQKTVADILGIHLSKIDQDQQQTVVKAEIQQESDEEGGIARPPLASRYLLRSAVCAVQ